MTLETAAIRYAARSEPFQKRLRIDPAGAGDNETSRTFLTYARAGMGR